jgi:uncharacterized membrane protein
MLLLVTGLILWTAAHLFRSCTPDLRESLQTKLGNGAKGVMGVIILISLVLMVIGYRNADFIHIWSPPFWLVYVNNVLMVIALYMYLTTATQPGTAFVFGNMKNPQLTGFKVWAFSHLLVNGDLASILLFGGLLAWAVLQVISSKRVASLVNRNDAPISSPWIHLLLVVAVLIGIALVHNWLGVYPLAA